MKSKAHSPEVSEQYFMEMQTDVVWKIRQEEQRRVAADNSPSKPTRKALWWRSVLSVWVWRPAVAVGVIALVFLVLHPFFQEKNSVQFSQLTAEETLDFIVEHAELFEPEELLAALPEESAKIDILPIKDEPAGEALLDAMMETLHTEDLETLY